MKLSKRKIGLGVFILVAVLLVGLRIYLPIWVSGYVNRQINALEGYGGSIDDIDIHLWRGAYQIQGLNIYKKKAGGNLPFLSAPLIDLSVEWGALVHGSVVAEIDMRDANLNFTRYQTGQGAGWPKLVDALSPLDINRFELHGGKISYTDYSSSENVNVYINDINAKVTNLRDVEGQKGLLPSDISITGTSIGKGKLNVSGHMNILRDLPDFDLDMKLEHAALPAFNDYMRSRMAIDFESGNLNVYAELAAVDGRVTGYIQPVATDIEIVDIEQQDQNPINALWESVVSVFVELFENQETDRFALRIPLEGSIDNPDRDMWSGFLSIFENAFGGAFPLDTDGSIDFKAILEESRAD